MLFMIGILWHSEGDSKKLQDTKGEELPTDLLRAFCRYRDRRYSFVHPLNSFLRGPPKSSLLKKRQDACRRCGRKEVLGQVFDSPRFLRQSISAVGHKAFTFSFAVCSFCVLIAAAAPASGQLKRPAAQPAEELPVQVCAVS